MAGKLSTETLKNSVLKIPKIPKYYHNSFQLGEPNIKRPLVDPAKGVEELMDATSNITLDEGTRPPSKVGKGRVF